MCAFGKNCCYCNTFKPMATYFDALSLFSQQMERLPTSCLFSPIFKSNRLFTTSPIHIFFFFLPIHIILKCWKSCLRRFQTDGGFPWMFRPSGIISSSFQALNVNQSLSDSRNLLWPDGPNRPTDVYWNLHKKNSFTFVFTFCLRKPFLMAFFQQMPADAVGCGSVIDHYEHLENIWGNFSKLIDIPFIRWSEYTFL